jgi:hypothetical protein
MAVACEASRHDKASLVAIDGKTSRRRHDRRAGAAPLFAAA